MLPTQDPGLRALGLLEKLYDRHAAALHRFALSMLGSREDAEDLLQALWLRLAERARLILAAEDPVAYLWTTARHLIKSRLRRRFLEGLFSAVPETALEEHLIPEPSVDLDAQRDLARAVGRLKPRFREAVLMVAIEGHTLEEAARLLGIPRGTVASRYHSGIKSLRLFFDRGER
jgi:RNA polymerase sigma-70 factor, ECF subfamily